MKMFIINKANVILSNNCQFSFTAIFSTEVKCTINVLT